MKNTHSQKTLFMVELALMVAIIFIMAFTPLGYFQTMGLSITFLTVPVAVGAIILGPKGGAICGLAGFIAVAGASHTISTSTAGGRGFTAIIVAWLAQFNTFVMILISFLLVFLQKGAIQIASQFNLNDYASNIITGIILFFILGSEFFINYRIILRGGKEGAK